MNFLATSTGDNNDDDSSDEESESESKSDELAREKTTAEPKENSDYDLEGTCLNTDIVSEAPKKNSDSDENGTCPPTTLTPEAPEVEKEIPKIVITKIDDDESDSSASSSSEELIWIISPFLQVPDVPNMKPYNIPPVKNDYNADSNEEAFNLIDSNDLTVETKPIEKSTPLHEKFSSFLDALMNSFAFAI